MTNNCENCARALRRLLKLKELQPGKPEGENQHCPDCGDRRFVVSITVASWLAGEDSDGRKLKWTEEVVFEPTLPAGHVLQEVNTTFLEEGESFKLELGCPKWNEVVSADENGITFHFRGGPIQQTAHRMVWISEVQE